MSSKAQPKGPWVHRFLIRLFTAIFAVLVYWVLGFLVKDIQSIAGPQYDVIEKAHVDQKLVTKQQRLNGDLGRVARNIANKQAELKLVSDSSRNLQKTINQLIELQKLSIQKSVALSATEQETLSSSLSHFLESQKQYQAHNIELSTLTEQKRALAADQLATEGLLEKQRKPAQEEYRQLRAKHQMRLACFQLLILIPLLAAGAFLLLRKRSSIYFPLFLGYGVATLLKVSRVIHEYFPSRYFKYILILVLLVAVAKLLVYFIRVVAFPKTEWLTKQYREAYERFLCPICEYPIRIGPRKFLFWTRRTVHKIILPQSEQENEPYACPACGTALFESCADCNGVRHSLLPNCQHCASEKRT
ncbi:MAG TPA: hypothetical protein DCR55_04660 [Lentisphaeria bacterium]|jgi:hypothetical protein|nr:hypothetical protein [Lentisphaeria bacterium]